MVKMEKMWKTNNKNHMWWISPPNPWKVYIIIIIIIIIFKEMMKMKDMKSDLKLIFNKNNLKKIGIWKWRKIECLFGFYYLFCII